MADVTKPARRSRRRAENEAPKPTQEVEQATTEEPRDEGEEQQQDSGSQSDGERAGGQGETLIGELRSAIRDAAIEVLKPVARQATTSAAKYAVTKGPDVVKDKVAPKVAGAGGAGALAKGVLSKGGGAAGSVGQVAGGIAEKVTGKGKGGKKPTGHGRGRRLPVQEHIDVAVDLETAYDQFTQFEDWPQFMHRVEKVEQRDDETVMFHENIWGVRRSWEAEIVEQTPCERIVWRSKGPLQSVGVATFHRLSDNLTRVQVNMDFQPKGLFEKTASGMRMSRRALASDLMRFRAFVEMRDDATGAWRGTIEEGEVTETPDEAEDARGEDQDGDAEASDREDFDEDEGEEPEASEEDEQDEDEGEEPEASEEDEQDEDEDEPEASEEDQREPEASRDDDYEDDYEEEEEPETTASSDESDSSDEEEDEDRPPAKPGRRRRAATGAAATSTRSRRR
jgi:uncharacterized membrane protein